MHPCFAAEDLGRKSFFTIHVNFSVWYPAPTSWVDDESSWPPGCRARHRDRLTSSLMFVRGQYGSNYVKDQRFISNHNSNTPTGYAPNDAARDPPETRRERQREVKATSRCIHKVHKEAVDDVRPHVRDGRDE